MSNDTTTAPAVQDAAEDTPLVGVGEPCGVCRFPVAEDQICGNLVYAVAERGTLPKFCGAPGQAELQARHNTPGNSDHKSELAGYPRKRLGMTAARAKELAERQAAALGLQHRTPAAPTARTEQTEPVAAQPVSVSAPVESDRPAEPVIEGPEVEVSRPAQDLAARTIPQINQGDLAKLAELLLAAGEVVGSLDDRLTAIRAAAEKAVATRTQMEMRATRENGLARDRADRAEAKVADAEESARLAREAQLRAEGQLAAAQARIESLEQQLGTIDERHRGELERVRSAADARADARIDRMMRERVTVASAPAAPAAPVDVPKLSTKLARVLASVADRSLGVLQITDPNSGEGLGKKLVDLKGGVALTKDVQTSVTELERLGLVVWGFHDDPINQVRYNAEGPVALVRLTELGVAATRAQQ